jgi:hypothetical protein
MAANEAIDPQRAEAQALGEGATPMCEAERQLKMVAFELDMQQTAGIWNPGKIRAMLTADHTHCDHDRQDQAA